jgi:hypothetical protein
VEHYRQQIEERLTHITHTEQDNGEELWERCKTIINSVAEDVLSQHKERGLMINARLP